MKESAVVQFKLNMPAKLRQKLGDASDKTGRSLSAEIIARLEKSFEDAEEWESALENIDDALNRIEILEREMRDVMYRTGSRDYSGN